VTVEVAARAELDLGRVAVRDANARLQGAQPGERFTLLGPAARHHLAVGLRSAIDVEIAGPAGYYCAGMNQLATVRIAGDCGLGVAENMMSGRIEVAGAAGQAAGASAHGGLLAIGGDAGARCGISLKGADLVVAGSVGQSTGFMAQSGRIVVCGDAGEDLGASIYEARLYVRGRVDSLGADCVEKPLEAAHLTELGELLEAAGVRGVGPGEFRRYGSARRLYHFQAPGTEAA
jgi:glutamate synthase domain-containing protein 3